MTVLAAGTHPGLTRLRSVVEEVIAPQAPHVDATEVPASHLAALATTGYLGWSIPAEHGGRPEPQYVVSAASELLAGACPSTFLLVQQHTTPVRAILQSGEPELLALLPRMARGELIGGAAFGHVRSWPSRRTLTATQVPGGWRLDGVVPWMSGAGLVGVLLVGAVDETAEEIILAVVDLPSVHIQEVPLRLAALEGSRTVALHVDGLHLPPGRIVGRTPVRTWHEQDGVDGPLLLSGAVGLARAALDDALARLPDAVELFVLHEQLEALIADAAEAEEAGGLTIADRNHWRARAADLAVRATRAALLTRGGSGLLRSDIAQVRARAALFLQMRGINDGLRAAHLARTAAG